MLILLLLSLETPLRTPEILMTTPVNACVLSTSLETPEEFFISYPFIKIKNDSLYFRGSQVLLLENGIPVPSLKDISFPSIERIEVLGEKASSLYGDYPAVVNFITKTFEVLSLEDKRAYSNIKLLKNPDHIQFEFGRAVFKNFDFYLTGDLNATTKFKSNIGYKSRYADLRVYLDDKPFLKGSLFSFFNFLLKDDFFSLTQRFTFGNHKILFGTDAYQATCPDSPALARRRDRARQAGFFVQDYWEPCPLLYIVPSLRYAQKFCPKISIGSIPVFNMIILGSLSQNEINLGMRWLESSINLWLDPQKATKIHPELRIVTPWIQNFKFTGAVGEDWTITGEFKKEFKNRDLGIFISGDWKNELVRFELKIIDVKIFYKLKSLEPSYGLFWEFWD